MLPSKAKRVLADNLRLLSGGTDTQAFRERVAKRTGGAVSARTIGSMMSTTSGNPTLQNIESVAEALGVPLANLFSENLGRELGPTHGMTKEAAAAERLNSQEAALSPGARRIIERLCATEAAGSASPALLQALERVLDLAHPPTTGGGYDGLDRMPAE